MTIDRDKYIVFKREDFQIMMGLLAMPPWTDPVSRALVGSEWDCSVFAERILREARSNELTDAVVIRKKDPFAASALHAYASSILTVIDFLVIANGAHNDLTERLLELADYFSGEADDATIGPDGDRKVPD